MAARGVALALAASMPAALLAASALPPCSVENMGYNSTEVKPLSHVLPLCQHECALQCQQECAKTEGCSHYMYYKNSGGCWLFGPDAELVDLAGVISGPLECAPIANDTEVVLRPYSTVDANATGNVTGVTVITDAEQGGPFAVLPWWGWLLVALGIALCGVFICLFAFCCGGRQTKKRSAKTQQHSSTLVAPKVAEVEASRYLDNSRDLEAAPLLQQSQLHEAPALAPLPAVSMRSVVALPQPMYEVAPPVITAVVRAPMVQSGVSFLSAPAPEISGSMVSVQSEAAPTSSVVVAPPQYVQQPLVAPAQYVQAPAQYVETVVAPPQYVQTTTAPAQYVETIVAPPQYLQTTAVAPAQYVETVVAAPRYVDVAPAPQGAAAAQHEAAAQPLFMEPIATGTPMAFA